MSRALGDLAGRPAGIIGTPEVTRTSLMPYSTGPSSSRGAVVGGGVYGGPNTVVPHTGDQHSSSSPPFLVVASDGVWEFLSSQEVVEMVGACLDRRPPSRPLPVGSPWGRPDRGQSPDQEAGGGREGKRAAGRTASAAAVDQDRRLAEACEAVAGASLARWRAEYNGQYIDDISIVITLLE